MSIAGRSKLVYGLLELTEAVCIGQMWTVISTYVDVLGSREVNLCPYYFTVSFEFIGSSTWYGVFYAYKYSATSGLSIGSVDIIAATEAIRCANLTVMYIFVEPCFCCYNNVWVHSVDNILKFTSLVVYRLTINVQYAKSLWFLLRGSIIVVLARAGGAVQGGSVWDR